MGIGTFEKNKEINCLPRFISQGVIFAGLGGVPPATKGVAGQGRLEQCSASRYSSLLHASLTFAAGPRPGAATCPSISAGQYPLPLCQCSYIFLFLINCYYAK